MMKPFLGFLSRLFLFAAFISVVQAFIAPYIPANFRFEPFTGLQLFFIISTLAFHVGLVKAAARSDQAFIRYFMGATGIKLFIYMTIMIVFSTMFREKAVAFISNFFLLYLLYTAFEVGFVFKKYSSRKAS